MYFVDRDKIESTLTYLESLTKVIEDQKSFDSFLEKLALERIGHLMIEAILDVGNAMIDGFIMRDPGSYEDIIDILEDESVIDSKAASSLKKVIAFRKSLVQEYTTIHHEKLMETMKTEQEIILAFPTSIRAYLQNELGPVSAFKK
ncbi:DUF86 domain-containing protein [Bacillus suaedaesalsae]|uniref:DUF86 domain-containing protein n=1 Tax=Bacillus suaedaesalsae TaxID=2810349 RepID=A0ABS2DJL7_9BACI|nr:DUF86 domain-containing protein [Bacillus suaedaesalsae]MBM6618684.1 DUF86 domain-containing protein [Bacillus suaedaesalsae]